MGGTSDSGDSDDWKQKYLQLVEQGRVREEEWAQMESTLRGALSRMSLVITGLDAQLDRRLASLRTRLKDHVSDEELGAALRTLAQALDEWEAVEKPEAALRRRLAGLLDRLPLESRLLERAHALKQELASSSASTERLLGDLGELLNEALTVASPVPAPRPPGMLRRWSQYFATDKPLDDPRELLRGLLEHLSVPGDRKGELEVLRNRLPALGNQKQLQDWAGQLADLLNQATVRCGGGSQACHFINDVLLQLLDRLQLSADAQADLAALQARLENDVAKDDWPDVLNAIIDLIAQIRRQAQKERDDIEEFFAQLDSRLREVDDFLVGMQSDGADARHHGQQLGFAVQAEMRQLHAHAREATEIGQLKQTIHERLEAISTHMEAFRCAEEARHAEAEQRIDALTRRMQELESEATALRGRIRQERRLALIDSLTGVHNRMAYEERVQQEYARWKRFGEPLSLVVMDVDRFKRVNDTYGHKAGDKVLRTIAKLLQENIRETDFLARYGGEEFIILMPGAAPPDAVRVADKLRAQIGECGFHYREQSVAVTASCGIAGFREGDDPDSVFERADRAMYEAKQAGRNCCRQASD